jgi:peptidoglycan/xylan/chitin deacetylase (PgdA/CDA1 family)
MMLALKGIFLVYICVLNVPAAYPNTVDFKERASRRDGGGLLSFLPKENIKVVIRRLAEQPTLNGFLGRSGLSVLMYHRVTTPDMFPYEGDVSTETFRSMMSWLKKYCEIIHPDQTLSAIHERRAKGRPRVLITFDDGCRDYYDNAWPIIRELEIPTLAFLCTSPIDNSEGGETIWPYQMLWHINLAPDGIYQQPWSPGETFDFALQERRDVFFHQALDYLFTLPDEERRARVKELDELLGAPRTRSFFERQMMTWDEIRQTMEFTTFGGHTHTHPIMSQLSPEKLDYEIKTCRDRILAETGVAPRYFSYPNGTLADFTDAARHILSQYGFALSFSTVTGYNKGAFCDPYTLKRLYHGETTNSMISLIVRAVLFNR